MSEHNHCHNLADLLGDFIDGSLSQELCQELETHMCECEDCRIVVDTLKRTIELYRKEEETSEPLPQGVRERLFYRLDLSEFTKESPNKDAH